MHSHSLLAQATQQQLCLMVPLVTAPLGHTICAVCNRHQSCITDLLSSPLYFLFHLLSYSLFSSHFCFPSLILPFLFLSNFLSSSYFRAWLTESFGESWRAEVSRKTRHSLRGKISKTQEQAVPLCRNMSHWGRVAWLNRDICWIKVQTQWQRLRKTYRYSMSSLSQTSILNPVVHWVLSSLN